MSVPIGTPALYNEMGADYESAFGHDPGIISFVKDDILTLVPAGATVLDIGCGTGKPVASLIAASGRKLHGIDYSSTMIALSRKQVPDGTFEQVGILDFEATRTYDAAVASMSLFNFSHEEMKAVVSKMATWVEPGGYLFLVSIRPENYERSSRDVGPGAKMVVCNFLGNVVDILLYTEEGWKTLLAEAGFEIMRTKSHYFEPEGNCDPEDHYFIVAKKTA